MRKAVVLALTLGLVASTSVAVFAEQTHERQQQSYHQQGTQTSVAAPELKLVKTLKGEDSYSILRPTFSPDGRYIAANLNESKIVRIWDAKTGEVLADIKPETIFGRNELVDGLEFSKTNNHIIVFRAGFPLKEIDWKTQKIVRNFDLGIQGPKIEDYAFTPDYKWLVFATPQGVDVWNWEKGVRQTRLLEGQYINTLDVSPDGKWVAFGKRGDIENSVGLINLQTWKVEKYPLANLSPEDQKRLPDYQVRHVSFEKGTDALLVAYMSMTADQARPNGPAGVFLVDLRTGSFTGPRELESNMLSWEPVRFRQPFNGTFINTFEFGTGKTESAAEFLSPNLEPIKTLTDASFDASLMNFRVSPDQKWMAGSFKEADGKVRLRLYEISPEREMTH